MEKNEATSHLVLIDPQGRYVPATVSDITSRELRRWKKSINAELRARKRASEPTLLIAGRRS